MSHFRCSTVGEGAGLDLITCLPFEQRKVPHGFSLRWRRLDPPASRRQFGQRERERADREELTRAVGLESFITMRQVHGTSIELITEPTSRLPVCDGVATHRQGLALMVQTADCVPMLVWDRVRNVVAAVHAGWRGTLGRVACQALRSMERWFDSEPRSLHVAIGPAIGPCCYEVGEEVFRAFAEQIPGSETLFRHGPQGKARLDLVEANRRHLVEMGVPEAQIYASELCTACDNELLYSYRREGKGVGRLMAVIGVVPSA